MIEEIKNALLTREAELTRAITSTDQEITAVATRIEQMDVSNHSAHDIQQVGIAAEVVEDLEAGRASL
jgi:septation ring formation regulator EzrA